MWFVKTFGQRFRAAREAAELSQDDIAEVCKNRDGKELSRAAVSYWESDAGKPTLENFLAAVKRMGTSADYLLGLSETGPANKPKPISFVRDTLTECIEFIEEELPPIHYPLLPPKERAKLITDCYRKTMIHGELSAVVLKLVDPIKAKYGDDNSHGRKGKGRA